MQYISVMHGKTQVEYHGGVGHRDTATGAIYLNCVVVLGWVMQLQADS